MQFATPRRAIVQLLLLSNLALPGLVLSAPTQSSDPSAPANSASLELNEKGVAAVQSNDFAQAEALFRKAIASDPHNLTAVFNLSGVYLNNKRQKEALALLDSYIKNYEKDAGLYARRGDVYFSVKEVPAATRDYEKALKLDPQYPGVAAKLSTLYVLNKRLKDAEKLLLTAVEQDPKNGQLLQNLSSLFLTNGKPNEAISTAKRALQVASSSEIYITLGNAYEALGDAKNSLISFQRASDLGDTRKELKEKIDQLKKAAS